MVHYLQHQVKDIGMCLFHFVQEQHTVGVFVDLVSQETTLVETHVSRRRANQTGDRMTFHVFGHIKADQLDTHGIGQLFADLRFPDSGGSGQQERTYRLFRVTQSRARHLDGRGKTFDGFVLAEYDHFQVAIKVLHDIPVRRGDRFRRDTGDLGDNAFDVLYPYGFFAP